MVTKYVIKCLETNRYYWNYRGESGWTTCISEAYTWDDKEELINGLNMDALRYEKDMELWNIEHLTLVNGDLRYFQIVDILIRS